MLIPGAAVIINPPRNLTIEEGAGAELPCRGQASPANLSTDWFRDGQNVRSIPDMERR